MAWLLKAIEAGGGGALALAMLAENLFLPIPSEAVLPLAGYAVQAGRLPFAVALTAATAGSVAGAWVLYAAGRFGGRPLLYRCEWLLRLDSHQLDRADARFDRHGPALVLWARMVPAARSAVSAPAGMSEMPIGRFTALTAGGSLVWNGVLIGAGMLLGQQWQQASVLARAYGRVAIAGAALTGSVVAVRWFRARRLGRRRAHTGQLPAGSRNRRRDRS